MKSRFFFLITVILLFNCRDENREPATNAEVEMPLQDLQIKVIINAIVPVTDYFEVYYYEPGLDSFGSNDYVMTKVEGSPTPQDITFTLPKDMFPERLRLDFGKIPAQKMMQLNSIKLILGSKEYEFSKNEIINEMRPSKFMSFNTETFAIETKKIEDKYDPYFYTPKLNNIINYLMED